MDEILLGYNTSTRSSFTAPYTALNEKTVFTANDGLGTSKYFAGAAVDNYVKFGGFYWRIIRMNGDKTTRLIYVNSATRVDSALNKYEYLINASGKTSAIKNAAFNTAKNNIAYMGLKYTTGSLRGSSSTSNALKELNTWYEANLKTNYGKYIDGNTGFCGDRSAWKWTSSGYEATTDFSSGAVHFGASARLGGASVNPVLTCANSSDLYTTSGASRGNRVLTNPIGLITADEAAMAGATVSYLNNSYYLSMGSYWTMSPHYFDADTAYVSVVAPKLQYSSVDNTNNYGLRPVINLKATTKFVGKGTMDKPFEVVYN